MKKLTSITALQSDEELFEYIAASFRSTITMWDYFVNWAKVFDHINAIEVELNIVNVLIGKQDIEKETASLIMDYPQVVKVFPYLIASRDRSFEVLTDINNFIYDKFDFSTKKPTASQAQHLAKFVINSGLGQILSDRRVKNLYDYVVGVEVGLDSNGRKNRGGTTMEFIVANYIKQIAEKHNCQYIEQATAKKIQQVWGLGITMDKSSRIVDFAINKNGRLYLVEVNFYGGGGSKLKSTATEYVEMYQRYHRQDIEFIWITDGAGWHSTLKPLREYFDKSDYLLSLSMLKDGVLDKILSL